MKWLEILKEDDRILFVLALISIAMLLDLLTGLIAAKITKKMSSKVGINGILRKIASLILLIFFIPVASLIPLKTGSVLLYCFYLSFLLMEIHSILENYQKLGLPTQLFKEFLKHFKDKKP